MMTTRKGDAMTTANETEIVIDFPTTDEIDAMAEGDMAINPFGRMAEIVEIRYRGIDVNGRAFCGYTVRQSETSVITMSRKADCVTRTVGLGRRYNSRETDALEERLRAERAAA
jgi:hypothetical protein